MLLVFEMNIAQGIAHMFDRSVIVNSTRIDLAKTTLLACWLVLSSLVANQARADDNPLEVRLSTESKSVKIVNWFIIFKIRSKNKYFKKPRGMSKMPFRRTYKFNGLTLKNING